MGHSMFVAAFIAAFSFFTSFVNAFDIDSNANLAVYYGQGDSQLRLRHFCDQSAIDIIPIGFVNTFPDQDGSGGFPGTNFGNQCWAGYYSINGQETKLLSTCPNLVEDIPYCQAAGKVILLSLGGDSPDYKIDSDASAIFFADFLWGAFGPRTESWGEGPRPFGDATVDGFDFDIEHGKNTGYATMAQRLRERFTEDQSKRYYLSAAPQCAVPDTQISAAIAAVPFDFIFVQFYNTPKCSARGYLTSLLSGIDTLSGDFTFGAWMTAIGNSANPSASLFLGLPAAPSAANQGYYLQLSEVQFILSVLTATYPNFGGVMLWEATTSENNQINGMSYAENVKEILWGCYGGKPTTTTTVSTVTSTTISSSSSSATPSTTSAPPTLITPTTPTTLSTATSTTRTTVSASSTTGGRSTSTQTTVTTRTPQTNTSTSGPSTQTPGTQSSETASPSTTTPCETDSASPTVGPTTKTPVTQSPSTASPTTTPCETDSATSGPTTKTPVTQSGTASPSETTPCETDSPTVGPTTKTPGTQPGTASPSGGVSSSTKPTSSGAQPTTLSSATAPFPTSHNSTITSGPTAAATNTPHVTVTTVITTSYTSICPTGFTTVTTTITTTYCPEETATATPTSGPHGSSPPPPEGWTTIVTVCPVCAETPTTVTLTVPKETAPATSTTEVTVIPVPETTPVVSPPSRPTTLGKAPIPLVTGSAPGNSGACPGGANCPSGSVSPIENSPTTHYGGPAPTASVPEFTAGANGRLAASYGLSLVAGLFIYGFAM